MKKLVFVGGGHAHMEILANLDRMVGQGYSAVLIAPGPYHYYSGMGPGMLGGTYRPDQIRFNTGKIVRKAGAVFVRDYAARIDPDRKRVYLGSGDWLAYDVLSCNAGSQVPVDMVSKGDDGVFTVKPIERLRQLQAEIILRTSARRIRIAIVGGGPSAAEIAGNIWQLVKTRGAKMPEIVILAGKGLLSHFGRGIRQRVISLMRQRKIRIEEGEYARAVSGTGITTGSGRSLACDLAVLATGVRPVSLFRDSGLPVGPDGGLPVNRFLQCAAYPDIFGGGDCIYFEPMPLPKLGVYAVRQNPVLLHNVLAQLEGRRLKPFVPGKRYLTIFNLGGGIGLFNRGKLTFGGRLAFRLKDFIDRRFMARYRALE